MHQPKWSSSDVDVKEGDIVLFLKNEGSFNNIYQYGMIKNVIRGDDGKSRKVNVEYQNFNENVKRISFRSVRSLVLIHPIDELNLIQELGVMANNADVHMKLECNM